MKAGRRLRSLVSQSPARQLAIRRYTPAASCCSDVDGSAFRSCSDFSAAVLRSPFFRLASDMRFCNSLASSAAVMTQRYQYRDPLLHRLWCKRVRYQHERRQSMVQGGVVSRCLASVQQNSQAFGTTRPSSAPRANHALGRPGLIVITLLFPGRFMAYTDVLD